MKPTVPLPNPLPEGEGVKQLTNCIVVDNVSDDATADVARALGATVARETQHNVAKVRNTGAKLCHGNVLVFVDADTIVPDKSLAVIAGFSARIRREPWLLRNRS